MAYERWAARLLNMSLKTRLQLFLVSFIIIAVVLITALCNYVFSHSFMDQLTAFNVNTVNNSVTIVDSVIKPYDQIIMQLFTDEEIRQMLMQDSSSYQSVLSLSRFTTKLSSVASQLTYRDIISVSIVSPNNKYTYGKESMEFHRMPYENQFYNQLRARGGKFCVFDAGLADFSDNTVAPVFMCGRLIRDTQLNEVGYIVMLVHRNALGAALSQLSFGDDYTYALMLDNGVPLYVDEKSSAAIPQERMTPSGRGEQSSMFSMNGEEFALFSAHSGQYGYTAGNVVSLSALTGGLQTLRNMTILLAVAFTLVALGFGISASKSIVRPISVITRTVTDIAHNDDLAKRIPQVDNVELNQLVGDLNSMLNRIDTLVKENQLAHQEQVKSELSMLMYQINPHFIYNTLNLIRWLAVINRQPQIKSVVENFSILIVNTMQDNGELVSLRDEIHFAESYVEIMKVRYETFGLLVEIPDELKDMRVPKFIFQPFIENSILHGFRGLSRRGMICIRAWRTDGTLTLQVEDNGVGVDAEAAEARQRELREAASLKIGLSNVHKRIQLRFGPQYGVRVEKGSEEGTLVSIELPAIEPAKGVRADG